MRSREERAARNESLFRDVNESVKEVTEGFDADDAMFLCECTDPRCGEPLSMTLVEYDELRSRGDRFAVAHGHADPTVERVVRENERFAIVEKIGEGAVVAHRLDPRG
jgi:hypothetical protein